MKKLTLALDGTRGMNDANLSGQTNLTVSLDFPQGLAIKSEGSMVDITNLEGESTYID